MKTILILQALLLFAWATSAPANKVGNPVVLNEDDEQYVFIDISENLAVLTTNNKKVVFGEIKRFPAGQIKISFQ